MFTKLSENEKDIYDIKMEISNILFDYKNEEIYEKDNLKNIHLSLFNAKK